MSSILKGIQLNEIYGYSDPDREYGASAPSHRKRGPYSHTDDDDGNPFAEYERQQRNFAIGRAKKAAAEKAQRDADHDRLATGTNEEQLDEISNEKLAQYKTAAAADAKKADSEGDYKRGDKRFSGIVKATKKQFANDEKNVEEEKQRLDAKCWTGYKKQGTKMKGDTRVNNCVPVKETNSHILKGLQQVNEGWKEKIGAAALAGSMALGASGAHARVTPDGQGGFTGGIQPAPTVTAPTDNKPTQSEAPKGFSKEYLQKAADPNRTGRYLISVEKAQELLKNMP